MAVRMFAFLAMAIIMPFQFTSNPAGVSCVVQTDTGIITYYSKVTPAASVHATAALVAFQLHLTAIGLPIDEANHTIVGEDGNTVTFHYVVNYKFANGDNDTVDFTLEFGNYYSFAAFNEIDLTKDKLAERDTKRGVFFSELTVELPSPATRFFGIVKSAQIIKRFTNDLAPDKKIEYVYVFSSSYRRTSTNCDEEVRTGDSYDYYYLVDETEKVILFTRDANRPVWYGLAVVVTAAAMTIFYFVSRRKKTKGTTNSTDV